MPLRKNPPEVKKQLEDTWLEKPGFLFLEGDLPIDVAHRILGCVVTDPRNPTDHFEPSNNYDAFKELELEIVENNCRSFMNRNNLTSLNGRLGSVFEVGGSTAKDVEVAIESHMVRTRTLMQHPKILKVLMEEAGFGIVDLMRDNHGTGYMIVGFKSAVDARKSVTLDKQKTFKFEVTAPVAAAAAAASGGAALIPSALVDPSVSWVDQRAQHVTMQSTMKGECIFAVRYRVLRLDEKTKPPARLDHILRTEYPGGVMAGPESPAPDPRSTNSDDSSQVDDDFNETPQGIAGSTCYEVQKVEEHDGGDGLVTVTMVGGDDEQEEVDLPLVGVFDN